MPRSVHRSTAGDARTTPSRAGSSDRSDAPSLDLRAVRGLALKNPLWSVRLADARSMNKYLAGSDAHGNPALVAHAEVASEADALACLEQDVRMLAAGEAERGEGDFVIRLRLKSLMSAAFIRFERAHGHSLKGRLTASVQIGEMLADPDAAEFAINYLGSRGHGFGVHGLKVVAAASIPDGVLATLAPARFVGIVFARTDLGLSAPERLSVARAFIRLGRGRIIADAGGDPKLEAIAMDCGATLLEGSAP